MSEPELTAEETDFETQLATLVVEAARSQQPEPAADEISPEKRIEPAPPTPPAQAPKFSQVLKPMVLGIEALSRAVKENTKTLEKIQDALAGQSPLPGLMENVQETLDRKQLLNQKLFDSLYEELRGYKDGFLLEVLHKPVVRDLITLFDDLSGLYAQMTGFVEKQEGEPELTPREKATLAQIKTHARNLDHVIHAMVEVMERVDVTRMEPSSGRLNKVTQRAVAIEPTESEEEDGMIARSVKPGFQWRERVVRPEQVVMKKWTDNYLVALPETVSAAQLAR